MAELASNTEPEDVSMLRQFIQKRDEVMAQLAEWTSAASNPQCEIVRYSVTMKILGIRLFDSISGRSLYGFCGGCSFIQTPTIWSISGINAYLSETDPYTFIISDKNSDLIIECQMIDFKPESSWFFENVEFLGTSKKSGLTESPYKNVDSRFLTEMPNRRIDLDSKHNDLQAIQVFVREWCAQFESVKTELWTYRKDSQVLDLRLQGVCSAGTPENLHVACIGCKSFKLQVWRTLADIELRMAPNNTSLYCLKNSLTGHYIECEHLQMTRNVYPRFRTRR